MNVRLINLSSALDFQVYVQGQELNAHYLHPKVVEALFLYVQMVFVVLNAKPAKITSK
jgi:hypothetical protein